MARHRVDDETLTFYMNPAVRPGRLERVRRFLRRYPTVRRLVSAVMLVSALAALALGQAGEPPLVVEEDRPESVAPAGDAPTGAVLDRDPVVEARAAVEQRTGQMRAQQSGQTGTIPAPSRVPVQQPVSPPAGPTVPKAGTPVKAEPEVEFEDETRPPVETNTQDPPAAANDAPTPADDVDDDPPPPPVTASPSEPPAEDQDPELPEEVCWEGWTYDDDRRECVRDEDRVPPELPEDPGSDDGGGDEHEAAVPVGSG